MSTAESRVCPVGLAGGLDNIVRRWLQNPLRILGPYVQEGMIALDVGCGPGFFTVAMAQLTGRSGRVIAVDLQEGMLRRVREKIRGTELEKRITLQKCTEDSLGVSQEVDFVLLFYMVHEVPNKVQLFREIARVLRPNGQVLIVEPPLHVSKARFTETLRIAESAGLTAARAPTIFLSKTAILTKGQQSPACDVAVRAAPEG